MTQDSCQVWKSLELSTCVGAIDGKHVIIKKADSCWSYYWNYKKTHSIILMVIAGPDYEFLWGNGGCNGRNIDGGVWNMSGLHQGIKNGTVKLPEDDSY